MNIYQRINEVRKLIGYIQKDKSVSTGGGSYRAVSHDSVTAQIREHLTTQGIVIVPDLVSSVFHQKEEGAKQRLYDAVYKIRFVNCEKPDDYIEMNISAHALDNGDKAPGKAISYATKSAILKIFSLETGEDEESRYTNDDAYSLNDALKEIQNATTLDELSEIWQRRGEEATKAKDRDGFSQIKKTVTAKKTALSSAGDTK